MASDVVDQADSAFFDQSDAEIVDKSINDFTQIEVYWPLIIVWGIVGVIYVGHLLKELIIIFYIVINKRRKARVIPEWSGAYLRRVPSAELLNLWKCDLCPHTSLEDCALRGCIGLPREVYLERAAQLAGTSGQNSGDPTPPYAEASTLAKVKAKSLRKKRGSGRAQPFSTDPSAEGSNLLADSSSSYDGFRSQRSNSNNLADDTLNGPPPYSYPSGSATN